MIKGLEDPYKKMTRRNETKAERTAVTLKKDTSGEGQRRKRALKVRGKRWSRTESNSVLLAKRKTSPSTM